MLEPSRMAARHDIRDDEVRIRSADDKVMKRGALGPGVAGLIHVQVAVRVVPIDGS